MKLTVSFLLFLSVIAVLSSLSFSFQITNKWRGTSVSNTKLFEDFNLDFDNPKIVTAKEIFTEKQYREFIKTYSTDERFSLVDFVLGFFKKNEDDANQSTSSPSPIKATKPTSVPDYAKALKPTVSIGILQEKTASFIQGKIDGKSFYTVLKAAFGDKLVKVLPDIIASLPQDKGDALAKAAK